MKDESGDEIRGLAHVEHNVRFGGGGTPSGMRDLAIAYMPMPTHHVDLSKVIVGPTQATSQPGDLSWVLELDAAQRIGLALLRAVAKAQGIDGESPPTTTVRQHRRIRALTNELREVRGALAMIVETNERHPGTVALDRCIGELAHLAKGAGQ